MKNNRDLLDLEETFEKININLGDKVLVSSDILGILVSFKKNNKKFDANAIIDSLIKKVGESGTLMFPTYNWDFCNGKDFNYNQTKSSTGSLSNFALSRKDFKRTKNPIYSYVVTGKEKDYICSLEHHSCFGLDSPFGYLIKNNGKNLFINMDYKDGLALVHVAEETVGVDYRYFKEFSGYCITKEKKFKSKYKMYVRDLNLNVSTTVIDKKFDEVLIKNKAYKKQTINGISFTLLDIRKTYEALIYDLKNKKGLIYPKKGN